MTLDQFTRALRRMAGAVGLLPWDGKYAVSTDYRRRYFKTKEEALDWALRLHRKTGKKFPVTWNKKAFGWPADLYLATVAASGIKFYIPPITAREAEKPDEQWESAFAEKLESVFAERTKEIALPPPDEDPWEAAKRLWLELARQARMPPE